MRDPKAALAVIDDLVISTPQNWYYFLTFKFYLHIKNGTHQLEPSKQINAGHEPSKEMLKKVRRRCVREMDYESDEKVESLARQFKIRMGSELRRNQLFNLEFATDYSWK